MAQIQKGDTFSNGQSVDATRLNQLVDSSVVLVGVITEQTALPSNTLEGTDEFLISDGGVLKKAKVSDILNSGLSITTNTVNTTANKDFVVIPNDGTAVLGSNYVSTDGLTVTVTTLSPHGLVVNNVVLISGAGTGYNGTFRVTAVTSTTFQYILYTVATVTSSPTACTYVRKASCIVNGNEVISSNLYVAGKSESQNLRINETADITTVNAKTLNATTALQINGVPIFGLSSIEETTIPFLQCDATTEPQRTATCNQWRVVTSLTSQTKTDKEIWEIEADFPLVYYPFAGNVKFSIYRLGTTTNLALQVSFIQNTGSGAYVVYDTNQVKMKCVIPASVTFTAETIQLRFRYNATIANASAIANVGYGGSLSDSDITRNIRVTKYIKA